MKKAPTAFQCGKRFNNYNHTEPPLADCQIVPKCFLVYIIDLKIPVPLYNIWTTERYSKYAIEKCFCNPRISYYRH